ncbi:MAG: aldo/keto reductase [Bacillota bacterium]|nr:aldo/keto reductase [Bacillota bacterium]
MMKKNKLGNTDLYVTPVSFGVLTIGNTQLDLPLEDGARLISYALSKGINFFDTAQYYETYPYLKEALKDIDMSADTAKRPIICTKSLCLSYEEMEEAIEEALRDMELSVIDIFLLHEVRQDPDWQMRQGAWQCLIDYKAKGVITAIGVSTHHVDVAEKMADIPECDILFPLINFAGLGIRKGDGPGTCEEMAAAMEKNARKGKGVFAMKAFGGGNLTGDYIKALDYVFSIEGVASVMVGMGKEEEVDRLVEYAQGTLSKDYQPDISHKKIHIDPGDCEGCGICIERCTSKAIFRNDRGIAEVDHSLCLTCGYCAPVCPVRAIIMY